MPTYDYECRSCGYTFEAFQAMSEEPLKTCPQCQGDLRRLIGGGMGIIFKGSGFYVNDSRQDGAKKPAPAGKTGASSGGGAAAGTAAAEGAGTQGGEAPAKTAAAKGTGDG